VTFWVLGLTSALAGPLTVKEVQESVRAHAPKLAAAEAKVEAARAKAMGSRGALDPVVSSKSKRATGAYDRLVTDQQLTVTTPWGPSFSAGHRLGLGDFPTYDGGAETDPAGEWHATVRSPLMAGLGMTDHRAGMLVADRKVVEQTARRDHTLQQLLGRSALAHAKWVAAGRKLALSNDLLRLAEQRQAAIDRRVAEGAVPPMDALDNHRAVLSRSAARAAAEQVFVEAGVALSLYLRDDQGLPRVPGLEELPTARAPAVHDLAENSLVEHALGNRPELQALAASREAAEVDLRLARATLRPKVDGSLSVSQTVLSPQNAWTAGVEASLPLAMRKARGSVGAARARLLELDAAVQWQSDQVSAEVAQAVRARDAAETWWRLSRQAVDQAEAVLELEQRAYELGASDLFQLTQREVTLARERSGEITAWLALVAADARLRTATATWM